MRVSVTQPPAVTDPHAARLCAVEASAAILRPGQPPQQMPVAPMNQAWLSTLPRFYQPYVVAVDPGRYNLFTVVDGAGQKLGTYTRAQRRHDVGASQSKLGRPARLCQGMRTRQQERCGYIPPAISAMTTALSQHTLRQYSRASLRVAARARWPANVMVMHHYSSKSRARNKLWRAIRAARTADKIVDMLAPRHPVTGERPLVLLGSGYQGIHSTYTCPGTPPCGLIGILAYVQKYVRVAYVNEAYTSQKCSVCYGQLTAVQRRQLKAGQWVQVTTSGKVCPTCRRQVPRDYNAARNICAVGLAMLRGQPRPAYLPRHSTTPHASQLPIHQN